MKMLSKFARAALAALLSTAPASAQWADPYAGLKVLQRSQEVQAAQEQARAMQQQVYLQQQQLELQRQQMQQQLLQQKQQLELQRRQFVQQEQILQQDQQTVVQASPRAVPDGVFLNSETILENGTKRCRFSNGLERVIPTSADCFAA
jgi:beta-N-acetylglucosaminidase